MEWKIGNVTIPNQVVVAPMAGISNYSFRMTAKEFGVGLVVCEMISDRGILYDNEKTHEMLYVNPNEHPVSIQVFGSSKETLVPAIKYVAENTAADIIDINMGCPVKKVVKTGAGSHWLLDPDSIYDLVKSIKAEIDKPLTLKMRTGWDADHILAVENALAAQEAGADAVAMHGRTREQMYSGQADWELLHEVAQQLTIPFMGNGDIKTPQDAKRMIDEVGADAVMVARGAIGNPWALKAMATYLETGELLPEPTPMQKVQTAKEQLARLVELKGERIGVPEFRQQAAYYLKGIPRSARTKAAINEVDTKQEVDDLLDEFSEISMQRILQR
ncbi:tRNA dihydrouridine synthase DusB [Bombilactobacillus thymidiniphilus]|uniref:tRNA-dihydrouridine synthase n=1 Tax=Bombilactobacillus thymidiniphilus TaxID=2923363 RepID=A0ABY4PE09_9LACO|nr:tRNA dihydrouridine synthase DusB [Bombilactobacillus thymidiniphilus]UQS84018.1 tRNA dihydrouridine synthase DusB [Bombilactobacillus thymidiniphilus]